MPLMTSPIEKPLWKKLGLKNDLKVAVINCPSDYHQMIGHESPRFRNWSLKVGDLDMTHIFAHKFEDVSKYVPIAKEKIKRDGKVWVSWPKKSSKLHAGFTEDHIRELAIEQGLVDTKVCRVDDDWSGLMLVIPKKDR